MKQFSLWKSHYELGVQHARSGDFEGAFSNGNECLNIVKKYFKAGGVNEQMESLDMYLKS